MYNILVIDDEQAIGMLLTKVLSKYGYRVETALDGLEGIRKFDESDFDMVITDIRMPGLDGNGVIKHIRESKKRLTPVVGLSGTPWLIDKKSFDAVLSKPSSIKTIIDTVSSNMRHH
ncbi:MAG: response regulator [Desulfobacteraceae bacterium]|nr:MAG: response regulator [Desulfobacteraceae bacterium]